MSEIRPIASNEQIADRTPVIKYSDEVLSADCPYLVNIDRQGSKALLELAGVPTELTSDITISVNRAPKDIRTRLSNVLRGKTIGRYLSKQRVINLYLNPIWEYYQKNLQTAEGAIGNNPPLRTQNADHPMEEVQFPKTMTDNKNLFPNLKSGKRLSWYLTVAPPERARKMVQKLSQIAASKQLNMTLQHESKHAADYETNPRVVRTQKIRRVLGAATMGLLSSGILSLPTSEQAPAIITSSVKVGEYFLALYSVPFFGSRILYALDPLEINAREFTRELQGQSQYQIATIQPRQ